MPIAKAIVPIANVPAIVARPNKTQISRRGRFLKDSSVGVTTT
jgi:hypothetical protein